MRRLAVALGASVLTLAVAGPVLAAKPVGECPNPKFASMDYGTFRQLSLDLGVPADLLGEEHLAGWHEYDRNDDGLLCIMDLPDTPGHFDTWIFNVIDNTARG